MKTKDLQFKTGTALDIKDILSLYKSVNWLTYTTYPDKLIRAIRNSLDVITAWQDEKLVGLIRTIGDGETILYIQDILVLPDYQRKGIGSELLKKILDKYPDVRQKVLLTDNTKATREYYLSNNFTVAEDKNLLCFVRIDI